MKFIALCDECGHKHKIEFDPLEGYGNAVRDWYTKHNNHEGVKITWPGRSYKKELSKRLDKVGSLYIPNADIKIAYAATAAYTITLASLATDTNLLTGRESGSVSNASSKYLDYLISGKITTGSTPTVDKWIEIWAISCLDDTPTWPDVFDGTDSAETITNAYVKITTCRLIAQLSVASTTDIGYPFPMVSLAARFGGVPVHHTLFVTHNTAVNLNSTGGNHYLKYTGVYATST